MIFRHPNITSQNDTQPAIRPAWQVFLETQKNVDPPYGIVFQADHARLSGDLAAILNRDVFGPLAPEVVVAIAGHDACWQSGDEAQVATMQKKPPRPFPLLPGEQSNPFWEESVRRAERVSGLTGVIVSRHFCALAGQDPSHRSFLEREQPRREAIERSLGISREDLDRWTAAIGFCDILSLYLCSGTMEPAEFRLAHPALPDSRNAHKVFLDWKNGQPRFSSPLIKAGTAVSIKVKERKSQNSELVSEDISWSFLQ
jgi:hypothetical protein